MRKLKGVKYIIGDISKKNSLKKINFFFNYVVNASGYVDHSNKKKVFQSHYEGCKNLAEVFLSKKPNHFIQIGSSAEYGKIKSPHKETTRCKPRSIYGKSKFLATKFFLNLYKKNKFPVTVLRPYQIYGPAQDTNRLIPITISSCLKNKTFPCSNGKQKRDFIYIDDFINLVFKCFFEKKTNGKVLNVGSSNPLKVKNIISHIKKKVKKGNPQFGKIKLRSEETLETYPNIERARKSLRWKPNISISSGLNKTISYYKQSLKKLK